ncbi:MAG: phycobilisome rod-core linker polypeptide [Cyanobacteria bacterium P01_G01_bin.38]
MALPLIDYPVASRNHRVSGFDVAGDEQSRLFTNNQIADLQDIDGVIAGAYRQIFNEQQMLKSNRATFLESQLRSHQITVREFIRGLLLSDSFRRRNYECNNNYRFVQMCIQRVLGRDVYDQREKLAWSAVLMTQGLSGFVDALLNSEEYMEAFGEDIVPYQRRRILPQRDQGEVSFAHMARYDDHHLAQLKALGNDFSPNRYVPSFIGGSELPPEAARKVGAIFTYAMAGVLSLTLLAVILSWFGWITI